MRVIVIGAGASGLMAALEAAKGGHEVWVLEKNEKAGKKIYITGKGRCNVTNNCDVNNFIKNVITNPKFLFSALNKFKPSDTMNFFEYIDSLSAKRIAVIGAGVSNQPLIGLLCDHGCSVTVCGI